MVSPVKRSLQCAGSRNGKAPGQADVLIQHSSLRLKVEPLAVYVRPVVDWQSWFWPHVGLRAARTMIADDVPQLPQLSDRIGAFHFRTLLCQADKGALLNYLNLLVS